mmetsp:Transcript_22557/g.49417  ORF Transcript_22557/g.49417 Transcript_22557/m.49417 type:complete len:220 (-) Transcript_22557:385-1044(-)
MGGVLPHGDPHRGADDRLLLEPAPHQGSVDLRDPTGGRRHGQPGCDLRVPARGEVRALERLPLGSAVHGAALRSHGRHGGHGGGVPVQGGVQHVHPPAERAAVHLGDLLQSDGAHGPGAGVHPEGHAVGRHRPEGDHDPGDHGAARAVRGGGGQAHEQRGEGVRQRVRAVRGGHHVRHHVGLRRHAPLRPGRRRRVLRAVPVPHGQRRSTASRHDEPRW